MLELGRWGARLLTEPAPGEIITEDSMVMAMRATFQPEAARAVDASYEIRLGAVVFHVRVADGRLEAGRGPLPGADLIIEGGPGIRAMLAGELSASEALDRGVVRITGSRRMLSRFTRLFRI